MQQFFNVFPFLGEYINYTTNENDYNIIHYILTISAEDFHSIKDALDNEHTTTSKKPSSSSTHSTSTTIKKTSIDNMNEKSITTTSTSLDSTTKTNPDNTTNTTATTRDQVTELDSADVNTHLSNSENALTQYSTKEDASISTTHHEII